MTSQLAVDRELCASNKRSLCTTAEPLKNNGSHLLTSFVYVDDADNDIERTEDIEKILDVLEADIGEGKTPPSDHNVTLERLKAYTTKHCDSGALFAKRGVKICCRYGFDATSPTTYRIALRCLCNILFLTEPARQMFVDENYPIEATVDAEDEFLSARLLLLCTYGTNLDFNPLFERSNIAEIIIANISRHAKLITSTPWDSVPAMAIIACSESLKLRYNLRAYYPYRAALFSKSQGPIIKMFNHVPIPSPPLQPPLSWIINSLVHLDVEDKTKPISASCSLLRPFDSNVDMDRLVEILRLATEAYSDTELDTNGSPLVQVLLQIAECAPSEPKARLRALLLPSDKERDGVLGSGESLSARLLRLSSALMAPNLRQLIPALLFELSDKDPSRFAHNVGYGYAAGFLLTKGLQLPADELQQPSSHETGRKDDDIRFNPITGQRRDMEPKTRSPDMTDEEKEREAERLFVLFERLRATGVVDVENPIAQAVREGRFEEVD